MSLDLIPFEYALKDYMAEHPELTEEEAREVLTDLAQEYYWIAKMEARDNPQPESEEE